MFWEYPLQTISQLSRECSKQPIRHCCNRAKLLAHLRPTVTNKSIINPQICYQCFLYREAESQLEKVGQSNLPVFPVCNLTHGLESLPSTIQMLYFEHPIDLQSVFGLGLVQIIKGTFFLFTCDNTIFNLRISNIFDKGRYNRV